MASNYQLPKLSEFSRCRMCWFKVTQNHPVGTGPSTSYNLITPVSPKIPRLFRPKESARLRICLGSQQLTKAYGMKLSKLNDKWLRWKMGGPWGWSNTIHERNFGLEAASVFCKTVGQRTHMCDLFLGELRIFKITLLHNGLGISSDVYGANIRHPNTDQRTWHVLGISKKFQEFKPPMPPTKPKSCCWHLMRFVGTRPFMGTPSDLAFSHQFGTCVKDPRAEPAPDSNG